MTTEDSPTRLLATYPAIVTNNADPWKVGRVRVRVPGLLEPESAWAWPAGAPGGGEASLGFFAVPPKGAEVDVFFNQGDPDHPHYIAGHWGAPGGQSQAPTPIRDPSVTPEEAPKIRCFETPRFLLVFDDREGKESFEIIDKVSRDGIGYDSVTRAMQITGTAAIKIESTGVISIEGTAVTIMGRPVAGTGPI